MDLGRREIDAFFEPILESLIDDPEDVILAPTQDLFDKGIELYNARPDKAWSLTDCISLVAMKEYGICGALTGDHHFEQAGFEAILK
jgi:predicted nucleic acid-binding protein